MMQELKHDLLSKTISKYQIIQDHIPISTWSISCFQPNNNKCYSFQLLSLNIKSKTKNKCSYEKAERVSLPHKHDVIQFIQTQTKTKTNRRSKKKHIRCDGIKI